LINGKLIDILIRFIPDNHHNVANRRLLSRDTKTAEQKTAVERFRYVISGRDSVMSFPGEIPYVISGIVIIVPLENIGEKCDIH
jgi:hypothetical protein